MKEGNLLPQLTKVATIEPTIILTKPVQFWTVNGNNYFSQKNIYINCCFKAYNCRVISDIFYN